VSTRRNLVIGIAVLSIPSLIAACSEPGRYRVLSFFFDGVPEPGAERDAQLALDAGPLPDDLVSTVPRQRIIYKHEPYGERRCKDCHSGGGYLIKTPEQGLCQMCHPEIPGPVRYLHGPLNVTACLACHEPHQSEHAWLLHDDPQDICFRCHDFADLSTGLHHDATDTVSCVECHDPHGGSDMNFLRRTEL